MSFKVYDYDRETLLDPVTDLEGYQKIMVAVLGLSNKYQIIHTATGSSLKAQELTMEHI